jgi:hypothetical protein
MPPRREPVAAATAGTSESMALMMPADVRADLLRAQQEEMGDNAKLAQVKVMAAGAGLFEFKDQSQEPSRTFRGVILNSHDRNVLWDKPVNDDPNAPPATEEQKLPACSSSNGRQGQPRAGFAHLALQRAGTTAPVLATGNEVIVCGSCPYNQFGTGRMFNPQGNERGKAVTNQKSIYVKLEGRETPVELVITPSSLVAYQEYIGGLLNQGMPVQAVLTEFAQEVKQRGNKRWGVVIFKDVGRLNMDEFNDVLAMRNQFSRAITPTEILVEATAEDAATHRAQEGGVPVGAAAGTEEIPF